MMEVMAKRMKAIRERIDGKRDLAAIKADAEAIASHAPHLVHLFPPGSTQKPTDARGSDLAELERLRAQGNRTRSREQEAREHERGRLGRAQRSGLAR